MESNKKVKHAALWVFLFVWAFAALSSCSAPKSRPPAATISMPTEELEHGRVLFNQNCASCHPEGMEGVGPAIINKPLPAPLMRFQIRNGVGVMPGFDEDVLSDEEVKRIAAYLVYLRKKD